MRRVTKSTPGKGNYDFIGLPKVGMNLNAMDAFIAATARVHAVTLATRNTKHFAKLDVSLTNPG